jgi:5-methylcytosine-specific restriction endonuclease McrA
MPSRHARRRTRHRGRGRCTCGRPPVTRTECWSCWFALAAKRATGSRTNGPALERIWDEQEGRCVYTGERLIPGRNASIDHVQPRSRGGRDAVANVQWVTKLVNHSKTTMTHEEFVAFCHAVAKRFPEPDPTDVRPDGPGA